MLLSRAHYPFNSFILHLYSRGPSIIFFDLPFGLLVADLLVNCLVLSSLLPFVVISFS